MNIYVYVDLFIYLFVCLVYYGYFMYIYFILRFSFFCIASLLN